MPNMTVGFPLYDGCTLLDFAGATQVFTEWAGGFDTLWLAADTDPVTTTENVRVLPRMNFANVLGGGVSSSIDLALELVERLKGVETRQRAELCVQYAPQPPLPPAGDPCNTPLSVVTRVLELQAGFIAGYRAAAEKFIGEKP